MDDNLDQTYLAQRSDRAAAAASSVIDRMAGTQAEAADTGQQAQAKAEGESQSTLGKVASTVGNVAADVGKGLAVEGVPQFLAGKTDAIKHAFASLYDVGAWLNDTFPGSFENPSQLETAARMRLADPNALTIAGQPSTATGEVVRKISEFMFGFKRAQALTGTSMAGAPAAGALGSFFTSDPNQKGLFDLVQGLPGVPEYLATNSDDPAVVNRLRHSLENAGLGAIAEGAVRAVRAFKASRATAGAMDDPAALQAGQAQAQEAVGLTSAAGGAADAPLVSVVPPAGSGTGLPVSKLATEVPPGTQALPSQVSTRPLPSGSSTSRATTEPSTSLGPSNTVTPPSEGVGSIDQASGRRIWQVGDDYKEMQVRAESMAPPLKDALGEVAGSVQGAEFVSVRAKDLAGLQAKIDTGRPVNTISDFLGGRISVDSPQAMADVIDRLGQRLPVIAVDDMITNAKNGYRAMHVQVDLGNGLSAEIQVVPSQIAKVQEGVHTIYDSIKRLNPESLSPADILKYRDAQTKIVQTFDDAWAKQNWTTQGAAQQTMAGTQDAGVPMAVLGKAINAADRQFDDMIASAGVPKGMGFNFNFAKMGTENIDEVTSQMAQAFKGSIDEARRGSITLAAQQRAADQLGISVESLLARPIGQAYNNEQLIAASMLFKASRNEMVRLAQIAEMPGAGMSEEFALRRQFALHQAIQEKFLGARAEAGRALGALRVASQGGTAQYAKAIEDFWTMTGGSPGAKQLAAAIIDLEKAGVADGAFNAAARRGWGAFSWDAAKELFTLGLLWRPATQIRNIVGNAAMVLQTDLDYAVAKGIGGLRGRAEIPGDIAAMVDGQLEGIKSGWRLAVKAFKAGEPQFGGGTTIEAPSAMRTISSGRVATEMGLSAEAAERFMQSGYGKAVDYLGNFVRVPGNFLTAGDDFFKQVNFAGRIAAEAHAQAAREGLQGQAFAARRAELIANPPEQIRMAAFDHANYATFHAAPGTWAQAALQARQKVPPLTFAMPFVSTPANLFRVGFEHTPLAPLVGQWRADVAAGGQARDLALAKMATGAGMLQILYDWAGAGIITGRGPSNKDVKETLVRAKWQPNSVQIGEKFYSISGLGQLAPALSFAGQMAEVIRERELDPDAFDSLEEWTGQMGAVLAASTVDQSFLQGFANLVSAVEEGAKGQGNAIYNALQKQAGAFAQMVPGVGLVQSTRAMWDSTYRDVNGFGDMLANLVPGLRNKLPFERDLWGKVREPDEVYGKGYNYASPFKVTDPKAAEPVDRAMADLGIGISRIDKKTSIDGVPVNFRDFPKAYEYYVQQAGNDLKHPAWGMGAKDFLNSVVTGTNPIGKALYDGQTDGPYGGKAEFIRDTVREYRAMAQQKLLAVAPEKFPDFDAKMQELRSRWAEQRAPMKDVRPVVPNVRAIAPPERRTQQPSGSGDFRVPAQ